MFTGRAFATFAPAAGTAERVLMDGRVDDAIRVIQSELATNPNDGDAHLLLCRAFYAERQDTSAAHECETATKLLPHSSSAQDWLGRAYGTIADDAGPLTGLKLALRVRDAFETAVALDPQNKDAVYDLALYYVGAPSLVGGGYDKARALATRVEANLPEMAHRIRGRVAEKSKDYVSAEAEYRTAITVSNDPDAWVDLGGMFKRRKMTAPAVEALQHALAADKLKDATTVDAASFLIDMHVQADLAVKTLQQYLVSSARSDDAPVLRVHLLIAKVLAKNGDKAGAAVELNKALALAANYVPAQKALQDL